MSNDPVRALVERCLARGAKCYIDRGNLLYVTDDRAARARLEQACFAVESRGEFLAIGLTHALVARLDSMLAAPDDARYARLATLRDRPVADVELALLSRTIKRRPSLCDQAYDKRFRQTIALCLRTHAGGALALCRALWLIYHQE